MYVCSNLCNGQGIAEGKRTEYIQGVVAQQCISCCICVARPCDRNDREALLRVRLLGELVPHVVGHARSQLVPGTDKSNTTRANHDGTVHHGVHRHICVELLTPPIDKDDGHLLSKQSHADMCVQ